MPVTADLIASTEVRVLELWPLARGKMQEAGLDILFVQGSLSNDTASGRRWRGTWMQRDNRDVCWPEVRLPADLGFNVRLLSVSYNDVALREKDIPKQEIADVIAQELGQCLFPRWELGRKRPVVLVGHEFGGDVIESLVMEAKGIVTNTRPLKSSTPNWWLMSSAEAFVRNVVQIVVYARQRVHDSWELNKDGSIDDSCSLFLCNPKSRFVEGIEPFSSWEEKAVWSLDSPGEHGDVWKPPNKRHESYSLLLESLLQARHEEHWKSPSPISTDVQVHKLWSPPMDKKIQETGLDILFVHGSLWKDRASVCGWRGTWMQRDNRDVCWPEVWLPADLGFNVRILSVSYNDVALREKDIPKQEIADVIAQELGQLLFPSFGVGQWEELGRKRPVVLVGHEFGGDVIESLVMQAKGIVKNTRLPRSSTPNWWVMSSAEAFVRNVVQIVVYARQRVHDNWELNKDGSIDDSCSLFLCNPKSWFVEGIEPFSSWEEKAVWSLDSPGEHGDVWKPPNERHESYSLLLESLLQARHEEHWKSPISRDLIFLLDSFSFTLLKITGDFRIQQHHRLPSLESVLKDSIGEIIVTCKVQVPEQRIQFLFGNAKSMARVVGVGLDFATVYLSRENLITIEKINQLEWGQLWREALKDGRSFYEPILIGKIFLRPFGHLADLDGSNSTLLSVCAFFFMTRNLLQLNAMAIHDCLQGGSSCLGMPSGKDKIAVETETCEWPSLEFLWEVLGCVGEHGVGCKCRHGEGDEDTIGDGGSATPGTNIVGRRVAQKCDHEDMPSASEGHHEGRESTGAEGERNYGHGDTPSEGGEGGGGDAPGERGEGGSNPGGGDDDRSSCHDGLGNPSEGTSVVVKVHPKYQASNCHWEENGERIDPKDENLMQVNIAPRLELKFQKDFSGCKLLTTEMSVTFDIGAAKPKAGNEDVNNNCFGWFQKWLSVSLQRLHDDAAQLGHEVSANTRDTTKTNKTNTQTTAGAWQRTGNLSVTPPFVKAGITVGKPTTTTTTLQEDSMETPTEHIHGGFLAQDMSERGQRHRLSYDFVYPNPPKDIKDTQGNNRSMYLNTGMCYTVKSIINGTWDDLNEEEASEYEFRAQWEVCELTKDARSKKKSQMKEYLQIYEMKLYINHKMTNIERLSNRTLTRRPDNCELVGIDIWPVIGSHGASSSAQ